MPQDFVPKRRMLAAQMVTGCEQLTSILKNLSILKTTVAQTGGEFDDTDFGTGMIVNGVNLSHLQAYEPNIFLGLVIPSLQAWLDAPIEAGSAVTNRMVVETLCSKIV